MNSPLQDAGAVTTPSNFAPLHTCRFATGLWTQRNPLGEGASPFVYGYKQRFDYLIDGSNVEMTSRLTIARRAGHTVYNSQIFPQINRFYEFRTFNTVSEVIRVMADCVANVYDATGPNTKTNIFTKSAGAGSSYFQSVGNTLYFGNGVDAKKWLQSAKLWAALTTFASLDFIVDTNNNIQVATGARSSTIINVSLTGNVVTVTTQGNISLTWFVGMSLLIQNLTGAAFLNGSTVVLTSVTYNQATFAFVHANYPATTDSGTMSTAGGPTGAAAPAWGNTIGAITTDGSQQWICKGNSVQEWGIAKPSAAPTSTNAPKPGVYPNWAASTIYSPSLSILDPNGNIQILTTGGITGAAQPAWALGFGVVTADGTAAWTNNGPAAWVALSAYDTDDVIEVTWSYWVTVPGDFIPACFLGSTQVKTADGLLSFENSQPVEKVMTEFGEREADLLIHDFDGFLICMPTGEKVTREHPIKRPGHAKADKHGYVEAKDLFPDAPVVYHKGKVYNFRIRTNKEEERHYILASGEVAHNKPAEDVDTSYTYEVTVTGFFQCTTAGNTGASQPAWVDGIGATVSDGTVVWTNTGNSQTWLLNVGPLQNISTAQTVIDSNGNKQGIVIPGKSSAAHPTWGTEVGSTTLDTTAQWINQGVFSAAGTAPWLYAFAGKNNTSGHVGTASDTSIPIILGLNSIVTVQGQGFTDTQVDVIQVYRTEQGGSTLLLLDEIPNPPGGAAFTYIDSSADANLSQLTQAALTNGLPPTGLINLSYHLRRIWGSVGNTLYYANGPATTNGVGNESFNALNSFIYPSRIVRTWPTSIGLLVFTVSDVYIVLGQGTSTSSFYSVGFLDGYGLLSYDAFSVNGTTAYLMTNASKVITLDPGAGIVEIGFPIGDQFKSLFTPSAAFATWHEGSSGDTALFVADGATGWFRYSATSAPETGAMWSPKATIEAGCKAVQSVEVLPGVKSLLVGPGAGGGKILQRDTTVNKDDAATFSTFATIGSITMAQPGQLAEIDFITLDAIKVGTRATVGVLLDEISGRFSSVPRTRQDPPLLPPSNTLWNDRYCLSSNQTATLCRHFQVKFSWKAEDAHNELLTFTVYGAIHQEKRSQ